MSTELKDVRVAFLVSNEGVEEVELTEPRKAVEDAGAEAVLVSLEAGPVQAFNHLDKSSVFAADSAVADVSAGEFDALVLPGGVANPDQLRCDPDAVQFVADFVRTCKPIGVICHGAWTLVEADVVRGRKLASWPSLKTDIRNAGGEWIDEEVVIDDALISSRNPGDLPAFNAAIVEQFAASRATAT